VHCICILQQKPQLSKAMGGVCCTAEQKEQFEARVEDAKEEAQEIKEAIEKKAEHAMDAVKDAAEEMKDTVEEVVEQVTDAVQAGASSAAKAVADLQDKVCDHVDEIKNKVEDQVPEAKEQVAEALAYVKDAAADAADAVGDVVTAAVAFATNTMAVEFDDGKGSSKSVHFDTQALGFSCGRAGGSCGCMSAPKAKQQVVVRNVIKNSQADKKGVKRGWILKSVNGTDVLGPEEGSNLLKEASKNLPEA